MIGRAWPKNQHLKFFSSLAITCLADVSRPFLQRWATHRRGRPLFPRAIAGAQASSSSLLFSSLLHTLYCDHHGWLVNWLQARVRCVQDASDLAQDTYMRLLRQCPARVAGAAFPSCRWAGGRGCSRDAQALHGLFGRSGLAAVVVHLASVERLSWHVRSALWIDCLDALAAAPASSVPLGRQAAAACHGPPGLQVLGRSRSA